MHFGIDYGARTAGTTAICFNQGDTLNVLSSKKKSNADKFIEHLIFEHQPHKVFIDAPLSLPGAFKDLNKNYSHRECDKATNAMSPMFLGGLTARAIELKDKYYEDLMFYESYPKALVGELAVKDYYKKDIENFLNQVHQHFQTFSYPDCNTWHEVDAVLCWLIGYRLEQGIAIKVGDPAEGLIYF